MTNDDNFLAEVRGEWRRDHIDADAMALRFSRHRRATQRRLLLVLVGGALIFACLIWLGLLALTQKDAAVAVAALAFAAALPLMVAAIFVIRRDLATRYQKTQLGLLLQTRDSVAAMRRALRDARLCAVILLTATAALALCAFLGLTASQAVVVPAAAWLTTAVGVWLWQAWRSRRLALEAARCERMIQDFEAADRLH
jgi:hypothetical protein